MSIITYNFSERGITHVESDMPCQDHSELLSYGMWRVAVVADGVGSCKHSEEASRIATKAALKTIFNCFPNNCKEEDILSLIKMAFHCAANAIEMHVNGIKGDFKDYHTTLALALYDGKSLYYGNAGDSGIVALDDYGEYHIVSKKQNNEYDEVITLASRSFEVGKTDYNVIAVLCMTDGILDWVVPPKRDEPEVVYAPRANFLLRPKIWEHKDKVKDEFSESLRNAVLKELRAITSDLDSASKNPELLKRFGNLSDGNLKDDLSVALLLNSNADMTESQIIWNPPAAPTVEELYCQKWKDILVLHPSVAQKEFRIFVQENNPNWNSDDIDNFIEHIIKNCSTSESKTESTFDGEGKDVETATVISSEDISEGNKSIQESDLSSSKPKTKSDGNGLGNLIKRGFGAMFSSKDDKESSSENTGE